METLLIILIVLAAVVYMGRKCWRAVAARDRGSCGCGSCRCGDAAGHSPCGTGRKSAGVELPCCSRER